MSDLTTALNNELKSHPAFRNPLFSDAKRKPWSLEQLRIIGPQYYYTTRRLPEAMAALGAQVPTEKLRTLVIAILYSELGCEKWEEAHYLLFRRLMLTSGLTEAEIDQADRFEETDQLVDGFLKLFAHEGYAAALGAEYALEMQSPGMIGGLRHGFQGFLAKGADDEFFRVHHEGEPAHIENVKLLVDDPVLEGQQRDVARGASKLLALYADFWKRLYEETKGLG